MNLAKQSVIGLLLLAMAAVQGCAPLVFGGAATGISVVHDRRTLGTIIEDQNVELRAVGLLLENRPVAERLDVSATSYNLRVLLTGQAADEQARNQYVEWVSHLPQVRRVYDEINIEPFETLRDKADDAYLTGKVNLALIKISLVGFDPTRVKVVTERGVVYLMGLLTAEEAKQVEETVRFVDGIKQVVKVFEII